MSWLLFMDESGHDHKHLPYEVRGGIALAVEKLWPFVQAIKRVEESCFGSLLHVFKTEIKGCKLLGRDRFRFAAQEPELEPWERRKGALAFLNKGAAQQRPARREFTAYGQACLAMVRGIFASLAEHDAKLFAVAVPPQAGKPSTLQAEEYLRRDHVFLLERFFYFLESVRRPGLLVMDETEKTEDRRFVRRLERYFTLSRTGRHRSAWIVPSPFFVSSEMTYPIQVADLCMYCVNFGYRVPSKGMNAPTRPEIATEFREQLEQLQFKGDGIRDGQVFRVRGITYVSDPYGESSA